jgi:putative protease
MIVYGYYPLMTSAQCVHANTAGCDHRPGVCYLQDRYRTQFPVKNICGACYNVIYNSLPVLLFAQLTSIEQSGVTSFRLDFTLEEPGEVSELFALFRARSGKWTKPCTNGHYKRGVE